MPESPTEEAAPERAAFGEGAPDEPLRRLPFAARFRLYLAERFPLLPFTLLIGSLTLCAQAVAQGRAGGGLALSSRSAVAFATVLLVFFHLRLMDESKDYDEDKLAHPDRLVSRGIVTLPEIARVLAVVIAAEVALNAVLGGRALWAYSASLAFTLGMRFEFGAGRLLRRSALLYAITHHPIVQLLGLYVAWANGAPFTWLSLPLFFGTGLGFEIARNTRSSEEDAANPHERTYSKELGPRGAGLFCLALALVSLAGAFAIAGALELPRLSGFAIGLVSAYAILKALAFVGRPEPRAAKSLEKAFALQSLALYAIIVAALAAARGVRLA
jgi:4-hydroxybenzoate polyprenyltransferase